MTPDSIKVLLIECDDDDRIKIASMLSNAPGASVELQHVQCFEHAESAMAEFAYDICLLDERSGTARGLDLLYQTLIVRPDAPIILLAEQEDHQLDIEATRAGAVDYLVISQLTPQLLERSIRHALETKRIEVALIGAQASLDESKKRYRNMVDSSPGMIYRAVYQGDGTVNFEYVSEGAKRLFGIEPKELLNDPSIFRGMMRSETSESYEESLKIDGEPGPWTWKGRFVLRSGEERVIQGYASADVRESGDVVWDGLLVDITDHMVAEHEAKQLASIVHGADYAILGKNLDGTITSWNSAAEELYGYAASEIIGESINKIIPKDRVNELAILLARIAKGEKVKSFETIRRSKDGELIDVSLSISPMLDITGKVTGASTISSDIRHRKRNEIQIARQVSRIQALRNIDMAITGSLDLRVTLNVLLDQVTTHLKVDCAAVLLNNPHTQRLEFSSGRGFRTTTMHRTSLRVGEGAVGRAVLDRRIVSLPDLMNSPTDFVRLAAAADEGIVAYWAVPLISKGRVTGVLELFHRSYLTVDDDWMNFLEALAGQTAIAIENADLFNDLQRSNMELQFAYDSTLEGWSKALDLRDRETEGHTMRVTAKAVELARLMMLPDEDLVQVRRGALLHDIGKMGIPDAILLKPGPLTSDEWEIMRQHPVYAYDLLSPIRYLRGALDIPYCHHERWDGGGYPRGIKGEQIPLAARIFSVVDVWDALNSDRPYRSAWPIEKVKDHLREGSGTQFDPTVVETFVKANI